MQQNLNNPNTVLSTFELLSQKYPPIIKVKQLAEILQYTERGVQKAIKAGRLPLKSVIASTKPLYRLSDVAAIFDSNATYAAKAPKRGRPRSSQNKQLITTLEA